MSCAAIINGNDTVWRKHFGISPDCATRRRSGSRTTEKYGTITSSSFEYSFPSVGGAIRVSAACMVNYGGKFSRSGRNVTADD